MSFFQIGLGGIVTVIVLVLLRVPIAVALGIVSFFGFWAMLGSGAAFGLLTAVPYDFAAHWTLSSIPMFLLMGYVCYQTDITRGIFKAARIWLSFLPGGLAVASVGGAALFSAAAGSSLACAAAMGRIAVPEMLKRNYDPGLSTAVVAAAGTMGSLIPPSILLIIYGIFAEVAISKLFLAAIVPGLLTMLGYAAVIIIRVRINPEVAPPLDERSSWPERLDALRDTWPLLLLVLGVFGGLFSGLFTPTQAGAVGAALSFVIAAARGTLNWRVSKIALLDTAKMTAAIFIIAVGANLFSRFLAISGVPEAMSGLVIDMGASYLTLVIGTAVIFCLLGMILDPLGILLLTLPILLPIYEANHISLIWLGVLATKLVEMALITPPVGLNVFVIKGIVGDSVPISLIFKGVLWFLAADVVVLIIMVAFPDMIMFLPELGN
ncbi:TRAP-T family transporter, DctM (12 TMs) subunit [Pseudooceanicola batsensis HTCC2597]|uniref:TRAP transporter large permease protein n=1 Tax=Pseudooceanicola batsensis (strain ATCC BAA-863 / DSM 15984 / KCTC 12145 / HTCC2597) TaxID=252305 RepID=A3TZS3_PSEBH|nr:TRAP transporter large permease [Pseudooceanicola batsensis]EAQ02554.1 TRAP-T family transporter, DctM (12 TMs) subunit [Pseudooceanicola batsensis HTCC2597]